MKLCGVCIITNDVLKLVDFYKEVFCIEPVGDSTHSAFDKMQLAIWNPGDVEISSAKSMSLMYFVQNAQSEYERLSQIKNIKGITKPEKQSWGVVSFTFRDPDGNEVSIIEEENSKKEEYATVQNP